MTVQARAGHTETALDLIEEARGLGESGEDALPWLALAKADMLLALDRPDFDVTESLYEETIENAQRLGLKMVHLQATTRLVALRRQLRTHPDGSDELKASIRHSNPARTSPT